MRAIVRERLRHALIGPADDRAFGIELRIDLIGLGERADLTHRPRLKPLNLLHLMSRFSILQLTFLISRAACGY